MCRVLEAPEEQARWCTYLLNNRRINLLVDLDLPLDQMHATNAEHVQHVTSLAADATAVIIRSLRELKDNDNIATSPDLEQIRPNDFIISYDPELREKISVHIYCPYLSFSSLTHMAAWGKKYMTFYLFKHQSEFPEVAKSFDHNIYNHKRAFVLPTQHKNNRQATVLLHNNVGKKEAISLAMAHRPHWPTTAAITFKDEFLNQFCATSPSSSSTSTTSAPTSSPSTSSSSTSSSSSSSTSSIPDVVKEAISGIKLLMGNPTYTTPVAFRYQGYKEGYNQHRLYLDYGGKKHTCLSGIEHRSNNCVVYFTSCGEAWTMCEGT